MRTKFAKTIFLVSVALIFFHGQNFLTQAKGKVVGLSPEVGEAIAREDTEPGISFRAEKHPHIVVINRQGQEFKGDLLGMNENNVILGSAQSVPAKAPKLIPIDEIQGITVKRSKSFQGCALGLVIGGITGACIGYVAGGEERLIWTDEFKAIIGAASLGLLGGIVGGIIGDAAAEDQQIDFSEKASDEKIGIIMKLSGL